MLILRSVYEMHAYVMFEFQNVLMLESHPTQAGILLQRILHLYVDGGYYFDEPYVLVIERSAAIEPLIDKRAFQRVLSRYNTKQMHNLQFSRPEVWVNHITRIVWLDDVFAAQVAGDFVEISVMVGAQLPFLPVDKVFLEAHLTYAPNIELLRGEHRGKIMVYLDVPHGNPWFHMIIIEAQIREFMKI